MLELHFVASAARFHRYELAMTLRPINPWLSFLASFKQRCLKVLRANAKLLA